MTADLKSKKDQLVNIDNKQAKMTKIKFLSYFYLFFNIKK